ncbi:MAG: Gfo/Idh/MocA family protein [Cellulosilyticaceae bacterium]
MAEKITVAIAGLGGRGKDTYASYIKQNLDKIEIVAIADLIRDKVDHVAKEFGIAEEMCFNSAEEMLEQEKLADAMLICTQDQDHVRQAIEAIKKGYHILLEKPISPDEEECREILRVANEHKRYVVVCHVLRYTLFYKTIKDLIDKGTIGEVVTVQAIENVGYWHQAHSFVRGNWRRKDETSPMILAKCCHDMDILLWLIGKKCKKVSSFGDIYLFKADKAPEYAAHRCLECEGREKCVYDAVDFYIDSPKTGVKHGNVGWPNNIVALDPTEETIRAALEEGPYGRCVYHCDNDVVDHQVVNLELEDGVTVSFTMSAFTDKVYRHLKIMGTQGYIEADMEQNKVTYCEFGKDRELIDITKYANDLAGHGGGDNKMMDEFIELLKQPYHENCGMTTLEASIESHLVAFKAEESRVKGGECLTLE